MSSSRKSIPNAGDSSGKTSRRMASGNGERELKRRRSRKLSQLGSDELNQRLAVSGAGSYFGLRAGDLADWHRDIE
jgi:hypothetical protein